MEQTRKEQLSIYYWLKDLFPAFINVVSEYPTEELILPTIAVISLPTYARPFELGGDDLDYTDWAVYVFAENSGQRDDYLSLIHRSLHNNICTYNYDVGFPPTVSPPQIGSLYVMKRSKKPLRVYEELIKKKYWSGVVLFQTYHNSI